MASKMDEAFEQLREKRDELQMRMDLGRKEARAAWEDLEEDWQELEEKFERLQSDTREAADQVRDDVRDMLQDVGKSLDRLRQRFV